MAEADYDAWADSDPVAMLWTAEQKKQLKDLLKSLVVLGQIHHLAKTTCSNNTSIWNTNVSALVTLLAPGTVIPNPTNLAMSSGVVRENLQNNLMAYNNTVQALGSQAHLDNILPLTGSEVNQG